MKPSIFIAVSRDALYKKKVVSKIVDNLNSSNCIQLEYNIQKLIYDSTDNIINFLENFKKNNLNILIFVGVPDLAFSEISKIKSYCKLFQVFGDISENYHSFYKYTQFLYDGILLEEPEYNSFFEVFGLPIFDGSLFNHESARIIGNNFNLDNLINLNDRKYDFSFIGRMDRPGRLEFSKNLKKYFKNIFIHDSSKKSISDEELIEIIKETKYFFNSTSTQPLNTFGESKFPERLQLHRSSRILEYAKYGCIIFSETLPQREYKTFAEEKISIIEVPKGVNKGEYCLNFLKKNSNYLENLAAKNYDAIYKTYMIENINLFFLKFLDVIKNKPNKFGNPKLNKKELEKIEYNYLKWFIYKESAVIVRSKSPLLNKIKIFSNYLYKHLRTNKKNSFLFSLKIIFFIFYCSIKKIKKLK